MTKVRSIATLAAFVLLSMSAFAWNCSTPGQVRVQVPTGTVGTGTGDGSGQVVVDNGLTFVCETLPTPPTTPTTPTTSNSTSAANSTSGATSGSTSNAGVSNSGNSSNKNSNKNTLNNTNTLSNTQQQSQTQSNASTNSNQSSASNAGNNSAYNNATTENTDIKVAAASAITPTLIPTAPCLGSIGGAAQSIPGGLSFGATRVDKGCDSRQAALLFAVSLHNPDAAARIMCSTRAAKAAKLTLAQCLASVSPAPVVILAPSAPAAAPIAVTVNIPAAEPVTKFVYIDVPHETVNVTAPLGSFKPARKPVKRPTTHGKPCIVPPSLEK
jgi:hypothetical protein